MSIICKECGTVGEPKTVTRGSLGLEILLWLCFLVPGLIYSIWRLSSRYEGCKVCGSKSIVPVESPLGKQLAATIPGATGQIESTRKPSEGAVEFGHRLGRMFAKK